MILLIGFVISQGCKEKNDNKGTTTLVIKTIGKTSSEKYNFTKGTALGLLKNAHNIKTKQYMIECIDGICADREYWWVFKVNNKTINYGANDYVLQNNDIIEFELVGG